MADAASNALYVYHFDGTGHTVAITNASQQAVNTYAYDPYGKIMAETETIAQPFKYVGQLGIQAEGNNLYYMRARYYDANIGRFISEDPAGFQGGLNLYAYVGGNPIMLVDPSGELSQGTVDFFAGFGDTLLLGFGDNLRTALNIDGGINYSSSEYSAGEWTGVAGSFATGIVGGIRAAGARGAGLEFSHWIPARSGGSRSILNGNFVTTETHALSDPYRYRFMSRAWKAENPMPSTVSQQLTRIPNIYNGAATGGVYGAAGAGLAGK
jgi:RHS repeat-associated protein